MSKPLSFTRDRSHPVNRLIILSITAIVLMVLDGRYDAVRQTKAYISTALRPLQWLADKPMEWYGYGSTFLQSQQSLIAANQKLLIENMRLTVAAQQHSVKQRELAELKTLQLLKDNGLDTGIAAEVVSNGKNPQSDKLLLNKGSSDGLRDGDAVVDKYGLAGQLTAVQPYSAEVTLLTHSQSVVPVMVERTGVRSLVYGDGGKISLRYFPVDADLQAGDLLVTSGMDSVYPAGIPVARVAAAERSSGTPYYRTTLAIPAALQSSRHMLVLPQLEPPVQTASDAAVQPPRP